MPMLHRSTGVNEDSLAPVNARLSEVPGIHETRMKWKKGGGMDGKGLCDCLELLRRVGVTVSARASEQSSLDGHTGSDSIIH